MGAPDGRSARLMGLEDAIGLTAVDPIRDERGWRFSGGEYTDPVNGFAFLSEAYAATDPHFDGPRHRARAVGPRDRPHRQQRVRRHPAHARHDFEALAATPARPLPGRAARRDRPLNERVYDERQQRRLPRRLRHDAGGLRGGRRPPSSTRSTARRAPRDRRYLFGRRITEADWRLFTTLVRFDAVYFGHFKCNLRRIVDYPNLWAYLRDLYQRPGVAETVDSTRSSATTTARTAINPADRPVGPADFTPARRGYAIRSAVALGIAKPMPAPGAAHLRGRARRASGCR